jgi:hypothetical protein
MKFSRSEGYIPQVRMDHFRDGLEGYNQWEGIFRVDQNSPKVERGDSSLQFHHDFVRGVKKDQFLILPFLVDRAEKIWRPG